MDVRLPSLNEIILETKKGTAGRAYATLKKRQQKLLAPYMELFEGSEFITADLKITWTEPLKGRLRDPDNISAGVKFLLDAMVIHGVLTEDNWSVIKSIQHFFHRDDPRSIEVTITGQEK